MLANRSIERTKTRIEKAAIGQGETNFRRALRSSVRGLWTGHLEFVGFIDGMIASIRRYITQAWREGAGSCGIKPSEMSFEEQARLQDFIAGQMNYLVGFANAIETNSKENGGKLGPLFKRAELWVNRYGEAYALAQSMACGDKKLKWVIDVSKESCSSCLLLNGRVYRASIWAKYDIRPRMSRLACGGYLCGCRFVEVDEPVTPGRPPNI